MATKTALSGLSPESESTPGATGLPYRELFQHMSEGLAYCRMIFADGEGCDFVYLDVNSAFETLTGLQNVVGKKATEAIPGIRETDPELLRTYARVAQTGVSEKFEMFVEALHGWFSISAYSPRRGFFVAVFDAITERRRMEEDFRASEDRFKLAQEVLNLGTWDLDLATGRAWRSPNLPQLYGRIRETCEGEEWLGWIHPDDRDGVRSDLEESLHTGETLSRRFRAIWPDGSQHWLQSISRVIRDAEDRPVRVVGIDFDITGLARNEERLRVLSAAVEQSPVSIVITDLEGTIEYVNPKATETTGYTSQELIGQNPRILKSGETTAEEYRHLWSTIRTGEWRGIFHNRKKNGELFWESTVICPILGPSRAPTHYLAVKEDVTARGVTEDALKDSNELFRLITETITEVFWMTDPQLGRILYVSRAYEEVWGRSRESLYANPQSFMEAIHPDDQVRTRGETLSGMASQQPFEDEYRIVRPDGSIRSIRNRGFPVLDADGRLSRYVGIALDITDQKVSQRSNADLAAIVESADTAIFSKDLSGKLLTWNAGAERIYGYAAQEIIGQNVSVLFPADRAGEALEISAALRSGRRISHLETVRITKSGGQIPVLVTASPICNGAGEVIGAANVAWDMTDLKLLQQQLAQAQKLESIGQLAAGIAHEINTPVQYIGDNAQFLSGAFQDLFRVIERNEGAGGADIDYLRTEIPNAISQMQEGVSRVAGIVRAMKRFSHPGPAEKVPTDLNQAIESTIMVSRHEWKYVADLTTDLAPDLPLVPCIAGEFNQVILNLIVNAAHAIAEVGKGSGGKGSIGVSTRRNGSFAEIRVSDTGSGIPEAIRSKVFDPFFTTKPVGKGTGQGLAIAYSVIAQKHRGTIHFESESGKGTVFVIRLPWIERSEGQ